MLALLSEAGLTADEDFISLEQRERAKKNSTAIWLPGPTMLEEHEQFWRNGSLKGTEAKRVKTVFTTWTTILQASR